MNEYLQYLKYLQLRAILDPSRGPRLQLLPLHPRLLPACLHHCLQLNIHHHHYQEGWRFFGLIKTPKFYFWCSGLVAFQSFRNSKENSGETKKGFLHGEELN